MMAGLRRLRLAAWLIVVLPMMVACGTRPTQDVEATATISEPTTAAEVIPAAPLPTDFDPQKLIGGWGGEFSFEGDPQSNLIVAQFDLTETRQVTVEVGFPLLENVSSVSSPVSLSDQAEMMKIQFTIPFTRTSNAAPVIFDGSFEEGRIAGTVRQGDAMGRFELVPIADFAPEGDEGRT
jgi:hypothetical protein